LRSIIKKLLIVSIFCTSSTNWAKIRDILPTGLQLDIDVSRPLYYLWKEKTGIQYELHTSLNFNRILLEGDYGWGTILRKNPPDKMTALAENIGQYFRIGLSYNFIKNSVDHNAAFLGARYGQAYFRDYLYGKLEGGETIDRNDKMHAHWLEIVAGVRVKVWEWIYTGCTVRYKFAKKVSAINKLNPFDIIGWGMNEDDAFGANLYIGIRIPLQANTPIQLGVNDK
jgi:hypothetical protein